MSELKVVKGSVIIGAEKLPEIVYKEIREKYRKKFPGRRMDDHIEEISEEELEKNYPTLKNKIEFAINNGGSFNKWKIGDGWSRIIDYNTIINKKSGGHSVSVSSESCILLALSRLCNQLGIDFNDLYHSAYPNEEIPPISSLEEDKYLCILPKRWDKGNVEKLIDDLEDVNMDSLASEVEQTSEIEKILNE